MKLVYTLWSVLILQAVTLASYGQSVTGTVFEDVNYGGGAGRTYAAANAAASASGFASGAIGRPGARVELYDAAGAFITATTTDAVGNYSIGGLSNGTSYTVRVVNAALTSARPAVASTAGLLPVQTFRTNAGAADAQRVGGENPAQADGAANTGSLVVTGSTAANNIALSLNGTPNGGDASLFVDNVEVLQGGTPLGTNPIGNSSFETPVLGSAAGSYAYNVATTGTQQWTFSPYSGIQANGCAFGAPTTSSGAQAAFIQSSPAGTGTVSQLFTLPLGTYQLRFAAANRNYGNAQTVNVVINGFTVLANVQTGAAYGTFVTQAFTVGPASTGGQALGALNAQSVAPFTATAGAVAGIDFGFSFDVVTNTNDSGQGSVRQFFLNSNALGNASLAQQGQTAGQETSIFMIPNGVAGGAAPAGLQRTPAVTSGLNGGSGANLWARLQVLSSLPDITDAGTALDATTQTANIQNSNPGQVGTGGTVGATAGTQTPRPLPLIDRPEVEIYGLNTVANVLRSLANNTVVRGLALHGAGSGNNGTVALVGALDFLIEKCMVGTSALAIADPTALLPNTTSYYNLQITGVSRGLVRNNAVAFANSSGLIYNGSPGSGVVNVTSNEFVQNGYRVAGGDNITAGDNGAANATGPLRVRANLIRSANSDGVQFEIGSFAGNNAITNNTFFDNGNGGLTIARSQLEGSAILYLQRTSTRTGSNNDSIAYNVINQSQASGVVVGYGQRGTIITRNSIYFNGTPFNSPTGSNLGIDLDSAGQLLRGLGQRHRRPRLRQRRRRDPQQRPGLGEHGLRQRGHQLPHHQLRPGGHAGQHHRERGRLRGLGTRPDGLRRGHGRLLHGRQRAGQQRRAGAGRRRPQRGPRRRPLLRGQPHGRCQRQLRGHPHGAGGHAPQRRAGLVGPVHGHGHAGAHRGLARPAQLRHVGVRPQHARHHRGRRVRHHHGRAGRRKRGRDGHVHGAVRQPERPPGRCRPIT